MKKIAISLLTVCMALGASAEGLSLRDKAQFDRQDRGFAAKRLSGSNSARFKKALPESGADYVSALVEFNGDGDISEFENVTIVKRCRGGFSIISMPRDEAELVASHPSIKSFSLSRPVNMKLDRARLLTGIDKIHEGYDLSTKYTGRGVVAGVVDNGIDPNHINFLYPDGSSRISMFSQATVDRNGNPTTKIYNYETVRAFTTDDPSTYHGTHTLGIMTGSYDGAGKMVYQKSDGEYVLDENCQRTPYYGVAPAADLAVGAGSDYDAYIVYNIENILDYAAQSKKRAVINLSLGSSLGPHDGSTSLNRYMDYICTDGDYQIDGVTYHGDNAIICIAAGNEGDMPIAWNKTISSDDPVARSFYISLIDDDEAAAAGLKNMRMGHMYVYGNDSRPFQIQLVAWNHVRDRAAWTKTLAEASESVQYYCSSGQYQQDSGDIIDANFANFFEGYVGMGTGIDTDNGRYFAVIDIATIDNVEGSNPNEEYSLGLVVTYTANDGVPQRIEAYGDADGVQGMGSLGKKGWIQPSGNGTISDMACGKNQIIVGSYNSKETWLALDGNVYSYGENVIPEGEPTGFSSFGTLYDGRSLPHVLAPGATIVSSSNYYYHTYSGNVIEGYNPAWPSVRQGETSFGGRDHYWVQMAGTSMSTPLVAGAMALWLEADPTLNVNDMRDIIATTSIKDEFTAKMPDQAKVGAGKFDAYAGLKEVLRRAASGSVDDVSVQDDFIIRQAGDRLYEIMLPGASDVDIRLIDLAGRVVRHATAAGDEATFDASGIASGIYVISVNNSNAQKIMIK